jgi:hypothetical protein
MYVIMFYAFNGIVGIGVILGQLSGLLSHRRNESEWERRCQGRQEGQVLGIIPCLRAFQCSRSSAFCKIIQVLPLLFDYLGS